MKRIQMTGGRWLGVGAVSLLVGVLGGTVCGCQETARGHGDDVCVQAAVHDYAAAQAAQLAVSQNVAPARGTRTPGTWADSPTAGRASGTPVRRQADGFENTFLAFATLNPQDVPGATSAPANTAAARPGTTDTAASTGASGQAAFTPPAGYWRQDLWHQMGHEALELGGHDFWHGFKVSYWNVPNALLLTGTMGASIAIRQSDVDDAVRRRTRGQHELGDMDETIQLLGNPGTHFAATGVLWLGSTLMQDMREHEVAKALTQALAVNGMSTLLLKAATNTRTPDHEHFGWPSGHTSSAFTVAAVLNEYYGPLAGVPSFALAGLVGYQRIDSRVHDFSDVVFGAVMGYVIGTSIARDDKVQFPELFGMKVVPYVNPETGTSGVALFKEW